MRYKVGAEQLQQVPPLVHRPDTVFQAARTAPVGPTHAVSAATGAVAEPLANRLRKNLRTLGAWARREGLGCWRLYDADMPEYAVAVDLYRVRAPAPPEGAPVKSLPATGPEAGAGELWAVVQEYEAPKTVEPARAAARLADALATVPAEQRAAVLLRDVQGFDYDEIARITNTELGTVKSRIHRGRLVVRDYLVRRGWRSGNPPEQRAVGEG